MNTKKKMSFFLKINPLWCKKCGLCMEECPKDVIGKDANGTIQILHIENCIACERCIMICPDFAVFTDPEAYEACSVPAQKKDAKK